MSLLRKGVVIAVVAAVLASCGTRGELSAPPGATKQPSDKPILLDKII